MFSSFTAITKITQTNLNIEVDYLISDRIICMTPGVTLSETRFLRGNFSLIVGNLHKLACLRRFAFLKKEIYIYIKYEG